MQAFIPNRPQPMVQGDRPVQPRMGQGNQTPPGVMGKKNLHGLTETFLVNLRDSNQWSRRQLMPGFEKRLEILRQYVGRHAGSGGAKERVPLPFIKLQTSILSRHLVSRTPRCLVTTDDPQLRPVARKFQISAADQFDEIDLERSLLRWVVEAILYPVGITKIVSGLSRGEDGYPDYGSPYVDNVDPERAVWDMAAKRWNQLDYIGHRYTVDKARLMKPDSGYDHDIVKNIQSEPYLQMNEYGVEKTETMSQDQPFNYNRLREYIDVWEIFLPKEGLYVHLPVIGNQIDWRPILVEPYEGLAGPDKTGPFHLLWYDETPGNLMPTPPVHAIYDLHEASNILARKLLRQAQRQKTNILYQQTMSEDAAKLKKLEDGGMLGVGDPKSFQETRLGGPDTQNMAFMMQLGQTLSKFGGNFDVLGGLAQDADTLGQEKLLATNSSTLVQFMQQEVYGRTRDVMRSILWYEWNSRRTQEVQLPIPGMEGKSVPSKLTPQDRKVKDFFRMKFKIHPYSMQPLTPQAMVAKWMRIFQGVIAPTMGMMQQQGAHFDIINFAKKIADLEGITDFDEVLKVNQVDPAQMQQEQQGEPENPRVRPEGTGEYHRTSSGPPGQNGPEQAVLSMMREGESGE